MCDYSKVTSGGAKGIEFCLRMDLTFSDAFYYETQPSPSLIRKGFYFHRSINHIFS